MSVRRPPESGEMCVAEKVNNIKMFFIFLSIITQNEKYHNLFLLHQNITLFTTEYHPHDVHTSSTDDWMWILLWSVAGDYSCSNYSALCKCGPVIPAVHSGKSGTLSSGYDCPKHGGFSLGAID